MGIDFTSLEAVNSDVQIRDNKILKCVTGFDKLTSVGSNIRIESNPRMIMWVALEDVLAEASGGETVISGHTRRKSRPDDCIACYVGEWSGYEQCTEKCGGGVEIRRREVSASNGVISDCGVPYESRPCNEQACPLACKTGEWSDWSTCRSVCGPGQRFRTKPLISAAGLGGKCEDEFFQQETCTVPRSKADSLCPAVVEAALVNAAIAPADGGVVCEGGEFDALEDLEAGLISAEGLPCTAINGSLRIYVSEQIDFAKIGSSIISVAEDLEIQGTSVTNMPGTAFASLLAVGRNLIIKNNKAMVTFDGFKRLHTVGDVLALTSNTALTTLSGFGSLRQIGGLSMFNCHKLNDINALGTVQHVDRSMNLHPAQYMQTLRFDKLASVGGSIVFKSQSSSQLRVLSFRALEYLGGNFRIDSSQFGQLQQIDLTAAKYIGGELYIYHVYQLRQFKLPKLEGAKDIYMYGMWSCDWNMCKQDRTAVDLNKLTHVRQRLQIQNAVCATKIDLRSLKTIGIPQSIVDLESNSKVNVLRIDGNVGQEIQRCGLESVELNLDSLQVAGRFSLQGLRNIPELKLPKLEDVRQNFQFEQMYHTSLVSAPKLKTVGSSLQISNMNGLNVIDLPVRSQRHCYVLFRHARLVG